MTAASCSHGAAYFFYTQGVLPLDLLKRKHSKQLISNNFEIM